ncbi:VanZ family protein, partial [Corynebacterium sp.]|uniref:VanZ family protein n=1 Tax=Corynebacterium sp. TaxID=1720 RepID=UPI003736E944
YCPGPRILARTATVVAVLATVAMVVAVTMGKALVEVGDLWDASVHRRRSLDFALFEGFVEPTTWWAPWLNTVGNVALFIPVGLLTVFAHDLFSRRADRPPRMAGAVLRGGVVGLLLSLAVEVAQYVFALGYSDVDDLLFNTLGAVLGAWLAHLLPRPLRRAAVGVVILTAAVVVLPMLGAAVAG